METCTKKGCKLPQASGREVGCWLCGKAYAFCEKHGGEAAARRSLKSHMGLYHPKTTEVRR